MKVHFDLTFDDGDEALKHHAFDMEIPEGSEEDMRTLMGHLGADWEDFNMEEVITKTPGTFPSLNHSGDTEMSGW